MNKQFCKVRSTYKKTMVQPQCANDKNLLCNPQPSGFGGVVEECINCNKFL
ncbi:hypothetical protein HX109_15505 [Galbibacter sp. BG1]|uniref:hypothetical protein n=1 Tax=Galbibacter sp. BG1 TaxID=1170699 RepID=UPI0015B7FEC7|nr:hypothetical protein [Galbibacter sp. BG1]QLE02906.1 hypothetical protein HX109_15505 [Galbibacter sp. BG1]